MRGKIRTWGKCPEPGCGHSFQDSAAGPMCPVHHTRPDAYFFDFSHKGQRERLFYDKEGKRLDTYKKALELQIMINKEIREHTFDPSQYVRRESKEFWVSTLLGGFLDDKLPEIRPSYRPHYKHMVVVASDHFGEKDIRDLRKADLKQYKLALEKDLSPKSVKNYLEHFKTFVRWCGDMKGIRTQITAFLKLPKYDPTPRWVEPADQIRLYELVGDRDKPLIGFLMLHPVRPGEARAIKIKDVNLRNQIITICRTWSNNVLCEGRKGPNGSASSYVVPIHPESLAWITQRVHEALPEAFLFINPVNGNHYTASAYLKVWDKVRIKAGIRKELRLYDATRHSIGTNLSNSGTDLKKLRDMMGHADIRTTLKYTHSNAEHLRIDLNKLSLKKPAEIVSIKKAKSQ